MDVEQPADSSAGAAKRGTNDESNARESIVEPTRIVINETVNQMRANSTRQPMQAKVPSLSLQSPGGVEEEKEADGSPRHASHPKSEEELEGQHNDQNEEDASAPKRTNKQMQPPQLKARFRLDEEDQAHKEELHFQTLPNDQRPGALTERVGLSSQMDPMISTKKVVSIQAAKKKKAIDHIPCLYLPHEEGGNKLIIYFHGNAEDIGLAFDLLYLFGQRMEMHVLAVEYPGYGLYKTQKPNEEFIKQDAEMIYEYLTKCVGIREKDIILFGRSMGSGPTSHLASIKNPYALLLMSPYTSIKEAAKSLLGWASFLSMIVYEKFRNIDTIKRARCPVFFLHGQQDTLIPPSHSQELHAACPMECYLHLPEKMDHNEFQLDEDLVNPFKDFIKKLDE